MIATLLWIGKMTIFVASNQRYLVMEREEKTSQILEDFPVVKAKLDALKKKVPNYLIDEVEEFVEDPEEFGYVGGLRNDCLQMMVFGYGQDYCKMNATKQKNVLDFIISMARGFVEEEYDDDNCGNYYGILMVIKYLVEYGDYE